MKEIESLIRNAYARHADEADALAATPVSNLVLTRHPKATLAAIGGAAAAVTIVAIGAATILHHHSSSPATAPNPSLSGPTSEADRQATLACQNAVGSSIASASVTTVGTVRGWSTGPGPGPSSSRFASAFPGESPDAFAAWCWIGNSGAWHAYAADSHGQKIDLQYEIHSTATPSGPPGLP